MTVNGAGVDEGGGQMPEGGSDRGGGQMPEGGSDRGTGQMPEGGSDRGTGSMVACDGTIIIGPTIILGANAGGTGGYPPGVPIDPNPRIINKLEGRKDPALVLAGIG